MAQGKKISLETVEKITKKLKGLPVKDNSKTRQEAVAIWAKEILQALERGYSLRDIADMLLEDDVKISPATIKAYLGGNGKKNEKKIRKKNGDSDEKGESKSTERRGRKKKEKNLEAVKNDGAISGQPNQSFVKPDTPDDQL